MASYCTIWYHVQYGIILYNMASYCTIWYHVQYGIILYNMVCVCVTSLPPWSENPGRGRPMPRHAAPQPHPVQALRARKRMRADSDRNSSSKNIKKKRAAETVEEVPRLTWQDPSCCCSRMVHPCATPLSPAAPCHTKSRPPCPSHAVHHATRSLSLARAQLWELRKEHKPTATTSAS